MKNLKKIRLEKKMTQEELAYKAGVAFATISRIENNPGGNIRKSTLAVIADALGVSVDELKG